MIDVSASFGSAARSHHYRVDYRNTEQKEQYVDSFCVQMLETVRFGQSYN